MNTNSHNEKLLNLIKTGAVSVKYLTEMYKNDSLIKQICFESASKRENEFNVSSINNCFNMTKEALLISESIQRHLNQ